MPNIFFPDAVSALPQRKRESRGLYIKAFRPVDPEEIAYALTIFVAAANRTLAFGQGHFACLSLGSRQECGELFAALAADNKTRSASLPMSSETSLQTAFKAVWHQYEGNALRDSICARVLGFYFLMERTGGAHLQASVNLCDDDPKAVALHPEVVEAIAEVELGRDGQLSEPRFYQAIQNMKIANASA